MYYQHIKDILSLLFFFLTLNVSSQNLIPNTGFEQNGQPYCADWYSVCGGLIDCDTIHAACGSNIILNNPPDSLLGNWSLHVRGSFPTSGGAYSYASGINGTYVYQLKFLMNTEVFIGEIYMGAVKNRHLIEPNFLTDYGQPWTEYTLLDTITTTASDSIGVLLTAGIGDFCICDVYYDQVELTIIDSLMTSVDNNYTIEDYKIFPNPVDDHLTIRQDDPSGFTAIVFDINGREIISRETQTNTLDINTSHLQAGIYFYQLKLSGKDSPPVFGRLIKQ